MICGSIVWSRYCVYARRESTSCLTGNVITPIQDINHAVAETQQVILELKFKAVLVRPNPVKGRTLDDPYYDRLYKPLQELSAPLMVHEGSGAYLPTTETDRFPK